MNDTSKAGRLDKLREEAYSLQNKDSLGEEFFNWYIRVLATLDEFFGPDSSEKREFQNINFELNPEFQDQIKSIIDKKLGEIPFHKWEVPLDYYRNQRLCDAAELLLAFRLSLSH